MIKEKSSALDVAKWFLAYNQTKMIEADAEYISNLKLQKLLYYAQGCFLALNEGEKLFDDDIVAWRHGPVVEAVYHEFKVFGLSGIELDESFDLSKFPSDVELILEDVYIIFGQYSAWKLREMTHQETPWVNTAQNEVISCTLIEKYFAENYVES